jgi:alkaline phosphatase D
VKVDVAGLRPGRDYWYAFSWAGFSEAGSPIGRTRTLPTGKVKDVVLAAANCALYPGGYYNAYQAIADLPRVDAVLFLGDYIYEYGADGYGTKTGHALNRLPDPPHECITLDDYRRRLACHRADPQLQAAHARAPWIVVWDDHETANDSWEHGAEDHQPATEGDWDTRKAAAIKAFYEWMPIREPADGALLASYRSFDFGDLASLIMTETRLTARTQQLTYAKDLPMVDGKPDIPAFKAKWTDPERRMMSPAQEDWIGKQLSASVKAGHAWQVLGNQVVMAKIAAPDFAQKIGEEAWAATMAKLPDDYRGRVMRLSQLGKTGLPYNLDSWDGYPADRLRLYRAFKAANARPIVLSGDSHAFWANELHDEEGAGLLAAEFGVTGISSPGAGDVIKEPFLAEGFVETNDEVRFTDQAAKGFLLLTLTRDSAKGEMMAVSTIMEKTFTTRVLKTYSVKHSKFGGVTPLEEV